MLKAVRKVPSLPHRSLVAAAEDEGGEQDERCGVGKEYERGLQDLDGRLRGRESPLSLPGEGVGQEARVLTGEVPSGFSEDLVPSSPNFL